MVCDRSAPIKSLLVCVENQALSEKSEKEDYDGQDTWEECQKKEMWRCLRVLQEEKVFLKNQERDG
jgi:hypothetical protein